MLAACLLLPAGAQLPALAQQTATDLDVLKKHAGTGRFGRCS